MDTYEPKPPTANEVGHEREPCPDRILDDLGGAFAMGVVGGSVFHFHKGMYHGSKGQRMTHAATYVRMNTPHLGGSFAVWGGLFSACDCTMVYLRQKEDPWNLILSGAFVGGFLSMRQGAGAVGRAALLGGCILACIEGAGIAGNKLLSGSQHSMMVDPQAPSGGEDERTSSWFGGLFGGGKEEVVSTAKTEVLESFDTPASPTFDF